VKEGLTYVRLSLFITFIVFSLSLIFSYSSQHSWNQLTWINALFFCSLLLLIIGGSLLIIQGNFFHIFIKSFKQFFKSTSKMEIYIQEIEGKSGEVLPYKLNFSTTMPLLQIGTTLFVLSIILSLTAI
jgi:hypothetical protein